MKKRIMITGSSGMLGTALCNECSKGYELYGADIVGSKTAGIIKFFELDITDKRGTVELIKRIEPGLVVHSAAYTDVDGCEEDKGKAFGINGSGTRNVALGCKEAGAALFYISTDFVFDGEKTKPYEEGDKPNPINIYGMSKLEGEKAVRKVLDRYVIIRSSWLFGKNGKNFVDTILKRAKEEKELRVVADQVGSPTYTRDLAGAIVRLIECDPDKAASGIYHVTNNGSVSWYGYTKKILNYAGIKGTEIISITSDELSRPAKRPKMSALDNGRYREATGHSLRHYEEATKEYISERRG